LNVAIKNYLENMRSSLDYLADQIFKENKLQHKDKRGKTYFPVYSKDFPTFKGNMVDGFQI